VCCFVLLTRGWGKLETRPLVALGFSQSRTLRFYHVASSPGSPLPHLLDGQRKLSVGCIAIPARSCPSLVRYPWESIVEVVCTPWPNLQTPTCYKASHMLNHHTYPTDRIRDKNAFDTSSTRVLLCSFFLSWVLKTQPNHWTKRMMNTRLAT